MAKVCPNCELTYSDNEFFCAVDGSPLRSTGTDADNLVGTVIADRYRIESILGEGGMGRVYRARHVRVPREAAIKVLRRALIADTYAVAAFNREARNAASVGDHPNVAAVYDFGETSDGLVFLAMEYIEGETLARVLEREPVLPVRRAVEIVRQIAAGLTAAHELPEPVVHRDLKPDNILLKTTRDGSDWVKIVDFGIAKAVKRDTQLLTTPGLVVGTPRYMSPEQLTGGTVDVRTDVYALAIIAYRVLTGRMPFPTNTPEEESTIQWALQRLTQEPLPLQQGQSGSEWPSGAQAVFDRALRRDPDQRTPSASEFARSLARSLGFSTPSGAIGAVSDLTRAAPVGGLPAASPEALTTPVPVPVRAAETRVISPAATARAAETPTRRAAEQRPRRTLAIAGVAAALVLGVGALFVWSRGSATAGVASVADSARPNEAPPTAVDTSRSRGTDAPAAPAERAPVPRGREARAVAAPAVDSSVTRSVVTPPPRPSDASPARGATTTAARTRATLDELKGALADPDNVANAGSGTALLDRIDRLLPDVTAHADSVEAMYYAVEINLILDKPAEACRLLNRLRSGARGTPYQVRVERFLADTGLACASRL